MIANFSDKLLFTMHSAPEINSLQDLKGKVVGVSGIGGSTDFATRLALREAGLVPDKDVAIRGVGGVPETVAALNAKAVHAGTLSPPSSFVAQKAGFKLLFDMSSLGVDYVSSGLGVKKIWLVANRLEAKQFVMAMIEGAKILTHERGIRAARARQAHADLGSRGFAAELSLYQTLFPESAAIRRNERSKIPWTSSPRICPRRRTPTRRISSTTRW